jgi:hypothetical protein
MRKPFSGQTRFDCQTIPEVELNLKCRDEIIPILRGLQHVYGQPNVRDEILHRVAQDVNEHSRHDRGREGLDYWHITVLAAARLGCDLDYDKLQDLAEQHRALRQIMGIGDWQEHIDFNWRRIRDNVCLLKPETVEAISHCIVEEAYRLDPEAAKKVRADSFVVETNIHFPTESSLIVDGVRKTIELCAKLSEDYEIVGWRQHDHLLKKVKQTARQISRIAARKGAKYKEQLAQIVTHLCLPKPGSKQSAEQTAKASVKFHQARNRHPGVESAIGALRSGNGLVRCRDESEVGFERYVALAVLGRNLHALGKLLITREDELAPAAYSQRAAA